MRPTIIPREEVAAHMAVAPSVLFRYEARGLVQCAREGTVEGYRPSEIRRLWTILSLQRDLGINLAGVEAILKLHDHVEQLHKHLSDLAARLQHELEAEFGPDSHVS